jgi:hypothetical protein
LSHRPSLSMAIAAYPDTIVAVAAATVRPRAEHRGRAVRQEVALPVGPRGVHVRRGQDPLERIAGLGSRQRRTEHRGDRLGHRTVRGEHAVPEVVECLGERRRTPTRAAAPGRTPVSRPAPGPGGPAVPAPRPERPLAGLPRAPHPGRPTPAHPAGQLCRQMGEHPLAVAAGPLPTGQRRCVGEHVRRRRGIRRELLEQRRRSWWRRSRYAPTPTAAAHSRAMPATAPTCAAAAAASPPSQPGDDAAGPNSSPPSTVSQ